MTRHILSPALTFLLILTNAYAYGQWVLESQEIVAIEEDTLTLAAAGGLNAVQYNTLDVNQDNTPDLVLFDRTSGELLIFLQQDDRYQFAPEYAALFPTLRNWVLLLDYNCDGKKDIVTSSGKRSITVYRNETAEDGLLAWQLVTEQVSTLGFSGFDLALQVNPSDIPVVKDVDQDGDLDIVTYNVNGRGYLEYYQNQSQEQYQTCDSLVFVAQDRRWGSLQECTCDQFVFGDQTCADLGSRKAQELHAGGKSLLALDGDGDGDLDYLSGEENCYGLYYLENAGDATETRFASVVSNYPQTVQPTASINFPAAFYEDVTQDGTRDLLVSPNLSVNLGNSADFSASSWLYRNVGTNEQPVWEWSTSTFLQQDMIDVGENAIPAFIDYDADGDLDLFIGNRGIPRADGFYAGVYFYENVGDAQQPVFQWRTADFLNLSQLRLSDLKIYFADLNGDAQPELLVSGAEGLFNNGSLYLLENKAPAGQSYQYDANQAQRLDLDFSAQDNLAFHDVDRDGQTDLLLGKQRGNLVYYRNASTGLMPQWVLSDEAAGGIEGGITELFLSPLLIDFDRDGTTDLLTTDISGRLLVRPDFIRALNQGGAVLPDTIQTYNTLLSENRALALGNQSWLTAAPLFGSGRPALVVGTRRGGISVYQLDSETTPSQEVELLLFPNPAEQDVTLQASEAIMEVQLINLAGQLLQQSTILEPAPKVTFGVAQLAAGLYLVRATLANGQVHTQKLIISGGS